MVLQEEINKIINELTHQHVSEISVRNTVISLHIYDEGKKLSLSSCIFNGVNYIPNSVRTALKSIPPFRSSLLNTFFSVEEEGFQVFLCYLGDLQKLSTQEFNDLIESFAEKAEDWTYHLNERGNDDLIYVPNR